MNRRTKRHRFSAYLRDTGPHARQWVAEAESFTDAAVRFAEDADVADGEVSLVVHDCETGAERCYIIDFSTGEVEAC